MARLPPSSVLVTGCSSGIGRASARVLKEAGWTVYPTARKEADLASLRDEGFTALSLDLQDSASILACVEQVTAESEGRVSALVNNAGFGQPGALEDIQRRDMHGQFETNVFGLLELSNALLPQLLAQPNPRLVHVSSVVGRVALPFMGIYSASKFAVEAIADVQRVELHATPLKVVLIEPGPITTEFMTNALAQGDRAELTEHSSRYGDLYRSEFSDRRSKAGKPKNRWALPPDAVGHIILKALSSPRPRRRYPVTFPAHLGSFLRRFAPDACIDAILSSELKRRAPKV